MNVKTIETVVRDHQAELFRYLRFLGAAPALAEDLLQEVFVAAYQSRSTPPPAEPRRIAGWLRGISRNLFLAHCRQEKRNPVVIDSAAAEQAEAYWVQTMSDTSTSETYLAALSTCLEQVSDRNRSILERRHQENVSRAQLADEFDMAEEGIKTALRRTREFLQKCIRQRVREVAANG